MVNGNECLSREMIVASHSTTENKDKEEPKCSVVLNQIMVAEGEPKVTVKIASSSADLLIEYPLNKMINVALSVSQTKLDDHIEAPAKKGQRKLKSAEDATED